MKIGVITDAHLFHKYAISPETYHDIIKNRMRDCDFIVDCGDITDKAILTAKQLDELLHLFSDINKRMYIIAGNHDSGENTTVASILELNNNITIIRDEPKIINDVLFVPYINNFKELYKQLNKTIKTPVRYAFSHLNITSNHYASLSFDDLRKIYKYSDCWINGHIHNVEESHSVQGNFYNIGSCSSLTFGDNHNPCYSIFDTESKTADFYQSYIVDDSIVHRNYDMSKLDIYDIIEKVDRELKNHKLFKLRCNIKMINNEHSIELRKEIREKLSEYSNILSINFSYVANKVKKREAKVNKIQKVLMMRQLIDKYEQDNKAELSGSIKKGLLDS